MAGSLVKISEHEVTSNVASISLTGIDSTFSHYILKIIGLTPDADEAIYLRFLESGGENSNSNYDHGTTYLKADSNHSHFQYQNANYSAATVTLESDTANTGAYGEYWIMNAANSDEYTFMTIDETHFQSGGHLRGQIGGTIMTESTAVTGVKLYLSSGGNFTSGKAKLYALKR